MKILLKPKAFGIILCIAIALIAFIGAQLPWLQAHAISALVLAIILGMLLGNTIYPTIAQRCALGVTFSKQYLLQLGIILYGFRLTFIDITHIGIQGALIDVLVLSTTFMLAWFVGRKLLKLDLNTVLLIGAGSSICGAAAVMATEPVVRARTEQVSVAVSTVLVFGTLSMLLYPVFFQWNLLLHILPTTAEAFGIFTGSTVHEVAQVVAAAKPLGEIATNTAVITKMVRVMMLAPFLIILSIYLARREPVHGATIKGKITIPWFALIFVLVAGINSLGFIPAAVVQALINIDTFLLAIAMAALGLCTHFSAIKKAGAKPLLLGAILFCWLIVGGALINAGIMGSFN